MSEQLPTKDCYLVNRDDKKAWAMVQKLCKNAKPGQFIPVTAEEFEALKISVIRIELPDQPRE